MPELKESISKPKEEIKEVKEKEPEMKLKFFFSPHARKEDFALLRKEIKNCDVYVPELVEHDPWALNIYRKVSSGELDLQKAEQQYKEKTHQEKLPDQYKGVFDALYNSKKLVYMVDLPRGYELTPKLNQLMICRSQAFLDFCFGKFAKAITNQRKAIETNILLEKKRENYIKKNIEQLKLKLLKDHPALKNKKEIKILASLGIFHTLLYHKFKKEKKIAVQQRFSYLPFVYPIENELVRRKLFFPEKEIKNKELAQSLIEQILYCALNENKKIKDTTELLKIVRYLGSKFNEKDIENFSKLIGKKYPVIPLTVLRSQILRGPSNWQELFGPPLKKWGVKLPETREEIEEIIKKIKKEK